MLDYHKIDVTEEIDVNTTSESKAYDFCHYWYFLEKWLKSQPDVCNGCHDVLMVSMNLSDIAIINILGVDHRCIVSSL